MSIKLRVIKENKVNRLNEKTYTIGDTQYWKRGDKYYSWTASGGRKEISNDEYLKALQNNSTSVKSTSKDLDSSDDLATYNKASYEMKAAKFHHDQNKYDIYKQMQKDALKKIKAAGYNVAPDESSKGMSKLVKVEKGTKTKK